MPGIDWPGQGLIILPRPGGRAHWARFMRVRITDRAIIVYARES